MILFRIVCMGANSTGMLRSLKAMFSAKFLHETQARLQRTTRMSRIWWTFSWVLWILFERHSLRYFLFLLLFFWAAYVFSWVSHEVVLQMFSVKFHQWSALYPSLFLVSPGECLSTLPSLTLSSVLERVETLLGSVMMIYISALSSCYGIRKKPFDEDHPQAQEMRL